MDSKNDTEDYDQKVKRLVQRWSQNKLETVHSRPERTRAEHII